MQIIAENNTNVGLDTQLNLVEFQKPSADYIVYHQCLLQLHLPHCRWEYNDLNKGFITRYIHDGEEELDDLLFKQLDYKQLLHAKKLIKVHLLDLLVGKPFQLSNYYFIHGKKMQLIPVNSGVNKNVLEQPVPSFTENKLSHFIYKRTTKRNIQFETDDFFVLINQSGLKNKLHHALTQYQFETGQEVDKQYEIELVLNPTRIEALRQYAERLMK